jgi:DNA replication protein DnaC
MNDTSLDLQQRATALKLQGLLAHWEELPHPIPPWVGQLLHWEEQERQRRGLQRRLRNARLGAFKPLAQFDWQWSKQLNQAAIEALMNLSLVTGDRQAGVFVLRQPPRRPAV